MMDRRMFFKACAAALGASLLPGCNESGSGLTVENLTTGGPSFSKAAFEETPSRIFSVTHDVYGVIDMELTQVDDAIFSPEVEQFSILLTGPASPAFDEGSYAVHNDELGNIELYLQPSEAGTSGKSYRAAFSLLV